MRTAERMIEMVRRRLGDALETAAARAWEDGMVGESIADAVSTLSSDLAMHAWGRDALMRLGDPFELVANQEAYALPTDCIALDGVEWRRAAGERWTEVGFARPRDDRAWTFRSGNNAFGGAGGGGPVSRDDGAPQGQFRLWPVGAVPGTGEYRLRYVAALTPPAFAHPDVETLARPVWEEVEGTPVATVEQPATEGMSRAVEWLAASLLAMEELEDGRPIGAFGRMYAVEFQRIAALSRPTAARRSYVAMGGR